MSKKSAKVPISFTIPVSIPSRVRLGEDHAKRVLNHGSEKSFDFVGFFRNEQELVCCAADAQTESGHPFASVFDSIPEDDSGSVSLNDLPSAHRLILGDRIENFEGTWTDGNQFDLKLGAGVMRQLGYIKDQKNHVHAVIFGKLLILMSPEFYKSARSTDLDRIA